MIQKSYIILIMLVVSTGFAQGVTGINTAEPRTTLDIVANNSANPTPEDGIIIPRVTTLNVTDPKEKGLLVFYEAPTNARGFYWWDGATWQPFVSLSQISADLTLAYAFCETNFQEGDMTANIATNLRTIRFTGLQTNDTPNYTINGSGELVVVKPGKYHVNGVLFIRNYSAVVNADKRDGLEGKIYVNGANASATNGNLNLEAASSFPTGNNTIIINISGVLMLNAGDRLLFKVNRFYRDLDTNVTIRPDANLPANITLKYLGA